ncbi:hypothetical protein EV183_005280 [Coemansia sp. RSA 2336]|nr:hypothetical protein EV183_005280 [Coemansia sp. RSA 2336]
MHYPCVDEYQHGDLIARQVQREMRSFLTPYTGTGKCIESIRSLACISVFPGCPTEAESFRETIPNYSKAIKDISRTCSISIDDVSSRLLEMFKSEMHRQLPKQSATAVYTDSQHSLEYWADAGEQTGAAGATQIVAAAGDITIFAVFLLAVWYFGWHLVHQWSRLLQRAYFNLAHSHILIQSANSSSHSIAISISEDKH